MERYKSFVRGVEYIENIPGAIMQARHTPALFSFKTPSVIEVAGKAFDIFYWNEFYNSIVHHEGFHAEQWNINPIGTIEAFVELITSTFRESKEDKLYRYRVEIEAFENQMQHSSFSRCAPWFQEEILNRLKNYKENMEILKICFNSSKR